MNQLLSLNSPLLSHDIPGSIKMEGKIYLRKKMQVCFSIAMHPAGIVFVKVYTSLTVLLMLAVGLF